MFPVGTRVVFTEDAERYPNFVVPAGTTGLVIANDDEYGLVVRTDQFIAGLTDNAAWGGPEVRGFQYTLDDAFPPGEADLWPPPFVELPAGEHLEDHGYDISLDGLRLGVVAGDDDELTYADIEDQAASSASSSGRSSGSGEGVAEGCDGDPTRFDSDEWYDLDNNMSPQDIFDSANGRGEVSMGRYTIGDSQKNSDADYIWFQPPMCSGGDYDNCGYLCRSNYESLCVACDGYTGNEDVCPDPWWMQLTGGHSGFGILIHAGRAPDAIAELLEGLARYPVLDEDHYDKLKDDGVDESWESWAKSDYKRALIKEWQMVHGIELDLDDVTDEDLRDGFQEAAEIADEYWREDGGSMSIDVDEVAKVAVAHDVRPVGAVILDADEVRSSRPAAAEAEAPQDFAPGQGTDYDIDLDGLRGLRGSTTEIIEPHHWVGPPDCLNLERVHVWYGLSWTWSPDYPTDIYAAVTVEQIAAEVYDVTGWKHRDPQQPSAGFDTEMVEVDSRPCEAEVQELMGAYAARTGVIPTDVEAAELLIRRIATQGLEDLGAWRGHSKVVHTDTARVTDLPDCHTARRTVRVSQDDSPGYDISLDGLRGAHVAATRPPDDPASGALAVLGVNAEYSVHVVHDTHLVLDDDMPPEEVEAREEAWRDGDYYCVHLIKRDVWPHMRVGTYCGVAGYGTALRAGFAIFASEWAQYVPNADVDAFYAQHEGAVGPDIYIGIYGQQQPTHWDHPSVASNAPERATDDSAGYDIDLDGLRGSVASRHMIAMWANHIARLSRYGREAPNLSEVSSKDALLTWHRWNDSNGEWTSDLSVDDLWAILRQYYDDEHGAADSAAAADDSTGYDIDLDGLRGSGFAGSHYVTDFSIHDADLGWRLTFTEAFFATLLSTQVDDDGNTFDESYNAHDVVRVCRDALREECFAFVDRWHVEIARGRGFEAAGADFAHVRNGDGGSFMNGGWSTDSAALQAAAEEYPEAELYEPPSQVVLYVRNYERGAIFEYKGQEIKVMLPDATWIGPYRSERFALDAYYAAVDGGAAKTADPDDASAGYDIDLDGLRGSVASRQMIADWANFIAHDSRYGSSAPPLHEGSSKAELLNWHRWNDRNGEWDGEWEEDDLWAILRDYYDEEHGAADTAAAADDSTGYDLDLDGLRGKDSFDASDFFDAADMREATPEEQLLGKCAGILSTLQAGQTLDIGRTAWRVESTQGITVYITKGKGWKLYTLVYAGGEPCAFNVFEVWPGSGQIKEGSAPVATWMPEQ